MGYYSELIEKKNARDYDEINKVYKEAKRIVDDLRRKYREISGRERDDGNFLYSIIEEKGMPTDSGDQQKAKHAAGLLESVRRMSTTPRDWGNSKGETNMGYYADLIKEKKEKMNAISFSYGVFEVGGGLVEKATSRFRAEELKKIWEKRLPKSKFEVDALPLNSKEEKGYYAKLAEEKAAKKNASASFRFHGKSFQYDPNNIDSVLSAARKIEDYKDDLGDEPSLQREYIAIQREIATARDKAEKAESKYRISGQDIHEWRI